jgi:hypothetical protein
MTKQRKIHSLDRWRIGLESNFLRSKRFSRRFSVRRYVSSGSRIRFKCARVDLGSDASHYVLKSSKPINDRNNKYLLWETFSVISLLLHLWLVRCEKDEPRPNLHAHRSLLPRTACRKKQISLLALSSKITAHHTHHSTTSSS